MASDQERDHALQALRTKLIESREWESKLKALRLDIKGLEKEFNQTEENIKALQSVGQIIGEVLKQLDDGRDSAEYLCMVCASYFKLLQ
jgi:26S proteasome regulatory subunit T4